MRLCSQKTLGNENNCLVLGDNISEVKTQYFSSVDKRENTVFFLLRVVLLIAHLGIPHTITQAHLKLTDTIQKR